MDLRLDGHDDQTIQFAIETGAGLVEIVADCEIVDRRVVLRDAHIQGLSAGALGRAGLNAIARKTMEEADVLEIHGAIRTTGRNKGRHPKPIEVRR